ncbi:MAG: hypothetical protein IKB42_04565 [Clostridia bacterium]|nr:hypothetical protein [Clostridia bacterium]
MKLSSIFKNLILCILIVFAQFNIQNIVVEAKTPEFAQIKNSNTYLYKSAEFNSNQNRWCILEKSYFVKILNNYNNDCYKVEYNGLTGFVLKKDIQLINEIPNTPYPTNTTFTISGNGCYMRTSPQIKNVVDNTICVVPSNTKLNYIGKIIGEEAVDLKGSVWYLTNYNGNYGYIYSGYTKSITPILANMENVTIYKGDDFSKINPLTNIECIVIIVLTLMPCIVILYLLYKPRKFKNINIKPKNTDKTIKTPIYFDENL